MNAQELQSFFKIDRWSDECPLTWLALLNLRVLELRVEAGEGQFAFVFDVADAQVQADILSAKGDWAGAALLLAVGEGRTAYALTCDGDCCSETWLADAIGVDTLLGHRVTAVRSIALPAHLQDDSRSRQEVDQYYGWEIVTAKGVCTLAVRNSSNGYYGGSLDFKGFIALAETTSWLSIKEDWSA